MESNEIKNLRQEMDLSQERFARSLGVSLQTVRRWERKAAKPLPIMNAKLNELKEQLNRSRQVEIISGSNENARACLESTDVNLGGLFKGLGNLFDLVTKMDRDGKDVYMRTGKIGGVGSNIKGIYGFSLKFGLGGKPVIEQFGNIHTADDGTTIAETREPLVDVFDEGDYLSVIFELPGVEKENVNFEINGDIFDLSAQTSDRKYKKELLLPCQVESHRTESTYRNGILEVRLTKVTTNKAFLQGEK